MSLFPRPKQDYTAELVLSVVLFVIVLLLGMISGCLAPAPEPDNPDDPVNPIVSPEPLTPRAASAAFGADISKRLSATSAELAASADAGEFPSLEAINNEWVTRVAADIAASKRPIIEAMNNTLLDETGEQPGDVAAELFRQLATGFEKGSK